MPRIALISDTHGLLRPEVKIFLQGADHIVHAGDIGEAAILAELSGIARLTTVRGNIDKEAWADDLPETEVLEVGGTSIYVLHDLASLELDPAAAGFRVVVSGHTHRPMVSERGGVIYINPGSCGPRRFKLPVSVAELVVDGSALTHRTIELAIGQMS